MYVCMYVCTMYVQYVHMYGRTYMVLNYTSCSILGKGHVHVCASVRMYVIPCVHVSVIERCCKQGCVHMRTYVHYPDATAYVCIVCTVRMCIYVSDCA